MNLRLWGHVAKWLSCMTWFYKWIILCSKQGRLDSMVNWQLGQSRIITEAIGRWRLTTYFKFKATYKFVLVQTAVCLTYLDLAFVSWVKAAIVQRSLANHYSVEACDITAHSQSLCFLLASKRLWTLDPFGTSGSGSWDRGCIRN